MMYKIGVKLQGLEDFKLFDLFLKSYPKVNFKSVVIELTDVNYLMINIVVKALMNSYMVTRHGISFEKFLKVACHRTLHLKDSSILCTSVQNFSKYGFLDENNSLKLVNTENFTYYYINFEN